jgi:Clp amino terminal domain, pathogenicity island component
MYTRFDTESRIAVAQATDIARELGHQEVGPGHLLLGLLANPRGTAYAALRDHGLDLDSAREIVASHHVETEPESPDAGDAGDAGDGETSGYAEDREALKAIGIDLDRVREAVRANLGDDLAERWADRPERGRGRRHRHHGHGRGRRGPRSRRDDGPRFSRELRALLRDVRRSVLRDRLDSDDQETARQVPGMTGSRLLVAITRSDDAAAQAVLATADSLDGLRAQAEAAVTQPSG